MTTESAAPLLGSIQEKPAQQNGIIANIRDIIATTLNPATVGTILPLADAMYLAYSHSGQVTLTRQQWEKHNGWGRYFTALEANSFPGEGA
jgi:hypothetical protein